MDLSGPSGPNRGSPLPLLVFGSGQRCGSTLVQRLLSSHPDVLVWGEHGGHLREVLAASRLLRAWDEGFGEGSRDQFTERGHAGWIANLLPEPDVVSAAARAYLERLFAAPAAAHGCARWGFKEVRFGLPEAEMIRELYPNARVVHITRDPRPILSSLEYWERADEWWRRQFTEIAMADWTRVNASFAGVDLPWVTSWRLEDAVANPDAFVADLAELIEVDPGTLDRSLMERKVYGDSPGRRDLKPFEKLPRGIRALLRERELRRVAATYGYEL